MSDITEYGVRAGTTSVDSLAFRKCKNLSSVILPEGLLTIGDAAFSYCSSLRQIQLPASVERIGVAAFCKSGLVTIQFMGVPQMIDVDVFKGCGELKEIVVPIGSRDLFIKKFGLPEYKVVEGEGHVQVTNRMKESTPDIPPANLLNRSKVQLMRFSYNARYFYWATGDGVDLRNVFSGLILLTGPVTYEFRRKALFIFVKSSTARTLEPGTEYELPADTISFAYKYQDKYASRSPRIFIFECDDGRTARVLDEVKLVRISTGKIMVRTILKV